MAKIKKIVVYFEDGTYEEVAANTFTWPPSVFTQPCVYCKGYHAPGMACPKLQPYTSSAPDIMYTDNTKDK